MPAKHKASSPASRTPVLEWIVGGSGVVLLAATVAFLVYEGLRNEERPGIVTTSVKEIIDGGTRHIVTFELHNTGSQTLSNVHVTARVMDDEREIERAQTVIDYLPGRSRQEGGFYLQHDPRALQLDIALEGYQKP